MGLFVAEDGQLQGWLAAFLCCCAAVNEDEHSIRKDSSRPTTKSGIFTEQHKSIRPSISYPISQTATTTIHRDDETISKQDLCRPISERPPSLRPLELGTSSLLGRVGSSSWRKSPTSPEHGKYSGSSLSLDLRRVEFADKQRHSLIPLKLSPVVLRDPSRGVSSDSIPRDRESLHLADCSADATKRHSRHTVRDTPFQRCQQLRVNSPTTSPVSSKPMELIEDNRSARPTLSTQSSSSSISQIRRQAIEANASSYPSRPSHERKRIKRKQSSQSSRKTSTDYDERIDEEILELNTIVEERRTSAARPQSPENSHIPAIAPQMPIRARTETLNDIGSAFSRPHTAHPPVMQTSARLSRPFTNMPETITRPATSQSIVRSSSRSSHRVSGWLSELLVQRHTMHENPGPFYKCLAPVSASAPARPRAGSEASLCTYISDSESPALTTAGSSPTSKSHSRSLTAESRCVTPLPVGGVGHAKRAAIGDLPHMVENVSQVGLAL